MISTQAIGRRAILLLALYAGVASAQKFPDRPVRFVVPYAAGGSFDGVARLFANEAAKVWGVPVIVENKVGASTVVATQYLLAGPGDGYKVLFTAPTTSAILPHLRDRLPYDPVADLVPVNAVVSFQWVLAVNSGLPVKSLQEWAAFVKASPTQRTYATSGIGTTIHLGTELVNEKLGIKLLTVPYKGGSEAMQAVVSGQVDFLIESPISVLPQIQGGKLRALAVLSETRMEQFPGIPTLGESGLKDIVPRPWVGAFVARGTSPQVIANINNTLASILERPEVAAKLKGLGAVPLNIGPAQFPSVIATESKQWEGVIKSLNLPKE